MSKYNPAKIEKKWQKYWDKKEIFKTSDSGDRPKYYILDMFPYPSGAGLHVGHPKGYIATDVVARMKMMQGYNVLHPMGWDAFGLPAENYAIKNNIHPSEATKKNIRTFKKQLGLLGFTYDWNREINTTDPAYYRWTQWMFLEMYKKGLVYESNAPVNWCPGCRTVLANEDLEDGKCERCGSEVEQKPMRQWVIRITDYAERLLIDLDKLPHWPEPIKEMQKNWIGKSEGAMVKFIVKGVGEVLEVFTTRPDTLFGATYCVVAPEHALLERMREKIENWKEVSEYVERAKHKTAMERTELNKEKTGVKIEGIAAINPVNGEELPIFVADYVLGGYGTGAIMAVPAHDERDWEFAKKYGLGIKEVVAGGDVASAAYTETGRAVNSELINGLDTAAAKEKMIAWLEEKGLGARKVNYRLQDWVFSRQRYWGEPIPLVKCERCGYSRPKILLLHGLYGHPKENWFPWFKREMEKRGYDVFIPDLPNADHPTLEGWLEALAKLGLRDSDKLYVVGHSLGAPAACQFILRNNLSVEKLILVAPTGKGQGLENWKNLSDAGCDDESIECIRTFNAQNKNLLRLKNLAKKSVIFLSDNDPFIPLNVENDYKALDADVAIFKGKKHFNESAGIRELPEILNEFPPVKKQRVMIIHGLTGRADKNWMPWMKTKLEEEGFEVFVPTMTTTDHPVLEKWMEELLPIAEKFGEDDIIVGHSLGGKATLHLLERLTKKISRIFLIAPAVGKLSDEEWARKKVRKPGKDYDSSKVFWEEDVDWSKIVGKVDAATIIYSGNDESVKSYGHEFWPGDWIIKNVGNHDHFTDKEHPVLFDIIRTAKNSGWVPLPENELPLELPKVKNYEPSGTGESPLATIDKWVNTKCPKCGGPARRETNTMPQWAGSCWYYLRYIDPTNKKACVDKEKEKYWSPVDFYVGGAEHATRHLIYARFWHKFLHDVGAVNYDEPFTRLQNVGLILAEDGRKMSKRWGNVINPDEVVAQFGADSMRLYEMFMGPFDQPCAWNTQGLVGMRRFLDRVWALASKVDKDFYAQESAVLMNKTVKKVTEDIGEMKFNTAIAQIMTWVNELGKHERVGIDEWQNLVLLLSPFAPHLCEELWSNLGHKESVAREPWPQYDPALIQDDEITIAVQVNGKLRDTIIARADTSEDEIKKIAVASEKVQKWLEGKEPKKIIYVKGKLMSIVV